MKRSRTAVIGLGNYLLADEGIGMHAIDMLRRKKYSVEVDFVDAGTPGMNLLHQFESREKIIFVDSGECGLVPGNYTRFSPEEVISLKDSKNFSLHEFDLIGFLEKAKELDMLNGIEVVIYCMQASSIKISTDLSHEALKGLPLMADQIYHEIERGRYHA